MKKLLIVSPHFPPINAPDMQRVRLALPYLPALGWEATVLAVAPEFIEGGGCDPLLEATYPSDVRVIRVRGIPARWTRWAGLGSLWWRCGFAVARAGAKLLRQEKFDLVFFSTTQFDAFKLGPKWKRKFGVPYVLDYQDPWVNDYYSRTHTRPPGGWLKFSLTQWMARRSEPRVLREASGVIAVSEAYGHALARSYSWFDAARVRVLPFGASRADFTASENHRPKQPLVDFDDGSFHHVYAGRCGPDMATALSVLFRAFKRFRDTHPAAAENIHFHFIGTDYAPPPLGREWVMPVARAEGVADRVHEHCYRVPYFDALYYLRRADALVAVGSDDPGYSASKIFPYILARRPMLMIFHCESPVLRLAREVAVGLRFGFGGPENVALLAEEVHRHWFVEGGWKKHTPLNEAAFAPFTAPVLTAKLAGVFDAAVADADKITPRP